MRTTPANPASEAPPIAVDTLLKAYRRGLFPMCHDDGELYWHDPDPRAVFVLDAVEPNQRMRRLMRSGRFTTTFDTAFEEVVRACGQREETWIDERIIASYTALYKAGHAHSVEAREGNDLVGGTYGVALGGVFFGESMFNRTANAGKVAFYALVGHLRERGFTLLDSQYINDFTASLGAVELPREAFRVALVHALSIPARF